MPVLVGDVRRVASSVAIVEPIASRHPSPLPALRRPYRFKG
jgi:glutathione S-transferase